MGKQVKHPRIKRALTEDSIDAAIDFEEMRGLFLWDSAVQGLRLRIGKHRCAWQFYADTREHGRRGHTFRTLGRYDRGGKLSAVLSGGPHAEPALHRAPWHTGVEAARKQARILSGQVAADEAPVGKRSGPTFGQAFDGGYINAEGDPIEGYLQYLERKAAQKKKPPRWAENVRQLGKQLLLPKWSQWPLTEMADRPAAVKAWHAGIKSATSANHCARIIRAMYKKCAAQDLRLSKANSPTAAVDMHTERGEQKGMAAKDFPAWSKAWRAIESPIRRAYHMTNLLTGARPGELARTRWQDLDLEAGTLTIGDAKAGNDIPVPLTPAIRDALKLARDAQPDAEPGDLIFPGCAQVAHREELPARGHALRRTYKTIAQNECHVPDEVSAYLLGHVPEGTSQRYLLKWAMSSGTAIREAQQKISRKIVELLHKGSRG